jgi:hypothetical protein
MKMKRGVKPSKKQEGYGITILLKDDKVKWFVIPANQCNRVERCLENYKDDAAKFVEFDTVKRGAVFLNLKKVTAVQIERRLYEATGFNRHEKSLTVHFAGGRTPESITAAETGDINLLANILTNIDAYDRRFVFVETDGDNRKSFAVNEVAYFELPYYHPNNLEKS